MGCCMTADDLEVLALITAGILVVPKQATGQMIGRLMDAVEPELVDEVERVAASVPEVQSMDRIRVRWPGHTLEASIAISASIVTGPSPKVTRSQRMSSIVCSTRSAGSTLPSSTSTPVGTLARTPTMPSATTASGSSQLSNSDRG